jgi:hypothetical protein
MAHWLCPLGRDMPAFSSMSYWLGPGKPIIDPNNWTTC